MKKQEVLDLMKSSNSKDEWNVNCHVVKKACGGYPDFWFSEIVSSGLMDKTLEAGSSELKFQSVPIESLGF